MTAAVPRASNHLTTSGPRLTIPVALEDGRKLGLFRGITLALCMLIAGAIVWASLTPIREIAVAAGQVRPLRQVKPVNHFEGGIVAQLLVQEGQKVAAGDPLVRLEPTAASADLGQLLARAANFKLQLARLNAQIAGSQPDFGQVGSDNTDLLEAQMAIFNAQNASHDRERATLRHRIAQRRSDVENLRAEIESLKVQTQIKQQQLTIQEELLAQGYTSKRAYLDAQSDYEAVRAQAAKGEGNLAAAESALDEAQSLLDEFEATRTQALVEEKSKAQAEFDEIEQALAKHRDRVERLYVRAPEAGAVHDLKVKGKGQVISPGEQVASIVPEDNDKVIAEVQLRPRDAGHVQLGDRADIKVTAFDPAIFGSLSGIVQTISPTTFTTQEGLAYYKVELLVEDHPRKFHGRRLHMLAGMEVQAEIVTGSKTLLQYLLKPVFRALDTAFVER